MFPVNFHGQGLDAAKAVLTDGGKWSIPEEVPIAFVFNRRNYAVMMGTPDDLVDFALGFALTEEVVTSADDIISLDIYLSTEGADLRFKVKNDIIEKLDITLRRRNLIGSASCGLCGLENTDTLFRVLPKVSEAAIKLNKDAIVSAMEQLGAFQTLNQQTRSVHGAAWVSLDGKVNYVREDVGRHNALDKLLGALALSNAAIRDGFLLMSSRCSYEIVEKSARRGVQAIVSISGPTAFALRKAKEANITLYARADAGAVEILE